MAASVEVPVRSSATERVGRGQRACDVTDVLFQPTRTPTLSELAVVGMAIEQGVRRNLMRRVREKGEGDASPDTEAARAREVLERLARAKPIAERTTTGDGDASSVSGRPWRPL